MAPYWQSSPQGARGSERYCEPPNRLACMELISKGLYGPRHIQSGRRGQSPGRLKRHDLFGSRRPQQVELLESTKYPETTNLGRPGRQTPAHYLTDQQEGSRRGLLAFVPRAYYPLILRTIPAHKAVCALLFRFSLPYCAPQTGGLAGGITLREIQPASPHRVGDPGRRLGPFSPLSRAHIIPTGTYSF